MFYCPQKKKKSLQEKETEDKTNPSEWHSSNWQVSCMCALDKRRKSKEFAESRYAQDFLWGWFHPLGSLECTPLRFHDKKGFVREWGTTQRHRWHLAWKGFSRLSSLAEMTRKTQTLSLNLMLNRNWKIHWIFIKKIKEIFPLLDANITYRLFFYFKFGLYQIKYRILKNKCELFHIKFRILKIKIILFQIKFRISIKPCIFFIRRNKEVALCLVQIDIHTNISTIYVYIKQINNIYISCCPIQFHRQKC